MRALLAFFGAVLMMSATGQQYPAWLADTSYGRTVDLAQKTELAAPVTIDREDITIAELLDDWRTRTGLTLRSEPAALDKHLAVFVHDQPLWKAMAWAAAALRAEWREHQGELILRLAFPPDDAHGPDVLYQSLLGVAPSDTDPIPWAALPVFAGSDVGIGDMRVVHAAGSEGPAVDRAFARFFASLNPSELALLKGTNGLDETALSDAQRQSFQKAVVSLQIAPQLRNLIMQKVSQISGFPGNSMNILDNLPNAFWVQREGADERSVFVGLAVAGMAGATMAMPRSLVPLPSGRGITREEAQEFVRSAAFSSGEHIPQPPPVVPSTGERAPGFALHDIAIVASENDQTARELIVSLKALRASPEAFDSLASLGREVARLTGMPVVLESPPDKALRMKVANEKGLLQLLLACEESSPGIWRFWEGALYFQHNLGLEQLSEFARGLAQAIRERTPRNWQDRRTQIERERAERRLTEPPLGQWYLLAEILTDTDWNALETRILHWDDLQPLQQQAYEVGLWDVFIWRHTTGSFSAPIKALLAGDESAGLPLDKPFNIRLKDDGGALVLEIRLAGGVSLKYRVPPGVEVEGLRPRQ